MDNPLSKRTVELTLEIFRQKLDYLLFLPPGSCIIALNVSLNLSDGETNTLLGNCETRKKSCRAGFLKY